jgi:hypothetical protein
VRRRCWENRATAARCQVGVLTVPYAGAAADWLVRKPLLTVYYLGVSDTTPEFSSWAALDAYLARLQPRER